MKTAFFSTFVILMLAWQAQGCISGLKNDSDSKPVTHELWNGLVSRHVTETGRVDYKGFIADSLKVNQYLDLLSAHHPNKNWSKNEQKAYWINAYNAFTVRLIVRNYPVASIKDLGGAIYKINTPWDIKFIDIEGEKYDLNNIEHSILRKKFADGRLHFALNCASKSCPSLRNEAYTAERLEAQLDAQAVSFINDKRHNQITAESATLSRIFKWFEGDFTKGQKLHAFINRYAEVKISAKTKLDYNEYDWRLNE